MRHESAKLSARHRLSRYGNLSLARAEITPAKVSNVGDALCFYEDALIGLGIKVVKPTLDYFVIHGGGNDQCNIEITLLAELLSRNLGIDQSRDYDKRCPYGAETTWRHSSVMNGQAES
jgi:hypothetical protein